MSGMTRMQFLLPVLLSAWMLLGGCETPMSPQSKQLLVSANQAYCVNENRTAIEYSSQFIQDNPNSPRVDLAYYIRGLAKYRLNDLEGAKADIDESLRRTKDIDLRVKALVTLGDIAYDSRDMATAENMYRQALADIEQGKKPSDRALYRLGMTLQRQGRWEEADQQFDRLIYLFEGTDLARRAGKRVHARAWTDQAGSYKTRKIADACSQKLRANGLMAVVKTALEDGVPVFVVQVGRYQTFEQADTALSAVKAIQRDAFVTVTR